MVKVIYADKTVRYVSDSILEKLISKKEISAYCGLDGWVSVEKISLQTESSPNESPEKRENRNKIEEDGEMRHMMGRGDEI